MQLLPDEKRLVTTCGDRKVRVFAVPDDPSTFSDRPLFSPIAHRPGIPCPPAIVDNGQGLIVAAGGSKIFGYDLEGNKTLESLWFDAETPRADITFRPCVT